MSILLAPVRVPVRVAQALDDLAVLADRARREPDPVEQVCERLDTALERLTELTAVAGSLARTGQSVDVTGRDLIAGGADLTASAKALDHSTRELIDGGADLTAVSERLAADLHVFRAALPRMLEGLDMVEELEGAVETVAETVEPLQGAAERVGRVTKRLSRSPA